MAYLENKNVVITGAGRGLGRAYAHLAAAEGASVIVNDIDADAAESATEEIVKAGGRAVCHVADVGDWAAAEGLIQRCVDEFGTIDGLVNNAGLFYVGFAPEQNENHLRQMVSVNIVGVAACATHAMRHMVDQGHGSIVNVVSGAHLGIKYMGAYGATKGAVASFTYSWALELEGTGVRVNAISPLARTRMGADSASFYAEHGLGVINNNQSPDPSVNAPLVVFLLSDASSALHGQIVRIEGHQLAVVAHPAVREPVLKSDGWTVGGIEAAFSETLGRYLVPVGMAPLLRAEYLSGASEFWDGRAEQPDTSGASRD